MDNAVREQMRDASTIIWLETLLQDLRYGLRILAHTPGVSAIAVLSLALGIAARSGTNRNRRAGTQRRLDCTSETLLPGVGGLLLGIPIAISLSRYLQLLLFGLRLGDGSSIVFVVVLIGFMALVASAIPANGATRIDPVIALPLRVAGRRWWVIHSNDDHACAGFGSYVPGTVRKPIHSRFQPLIVTIAIVRSTSSSFVNR